MKGSSFKRIIALLAAVLVALCLLAGCGAEPAGETLLAESQKDDFALYHIGGGAVRLHYNSMEQVFDGWGKPSGNIKWAFYDFDGDENEEVMVIYQTENRTGSWTEDLHIVLDEGHSLADHAFTTDDVSAWFAQRMICTPGSYDGTVDIVIDGDHWKSKLNVSDYDWTQPIAIDHCMFHPGVGITLQAGSITLSGAFSAEVTFDGE